jgi:cytochrome d ubiquinol oxidase subunit II
VHTTGLELFWFLLIGVLWAGYFFLEGFDFGVGMLLPLMGRTDIERRAVINTIGATWDGNEVWVIVAGGATFAAFPLWYARMFSAFYLALFILLVALIVRGVAFEYRGKRDDPSWRRRWDAVITVGSAVPALLWGVAFGDLIKGIPITASGVFTGSLLSLLQPYALLAGLATLTLFLLHGALFLNLKTTGHLRERARDLAARIAPVTAVVILAFLAWTWEVARVEHHAGDVPGMIPTSALLLVIAASWLNRERLSGWAFAVTGIAILAITATVFMTMYPDVITSSIAPSASLTVAEAASQPYTLRAMTIVAIIFTPFVLLYQGWTYYIFRRRISLPHDETPLVEQTPRA